MEFNGATVGLSHLQGGTCRSWAITIVGARSSIHGKCQLAARGFLYILMGRGHDNSSLRIVGGISAYARYSSLASRV